MRTTFRWIFRTIFLAVLLLSLSLNIASFVGHALWQTASVIWEGTTGLTSFAGSQIEQIKNLTDLEAKTAKKYNKVLKENNTLERKIAGLQDDIKVQRTASKTATRKLAEAKTELANNRRQLKRIKSEMTDPLVRKVSYRGRKVAMKEAVTEVSDRISSRAVKSATREVSSMAGESIPFWGTAIVVGVTALEIRDLCNTLKDMNELKRIFNPEDKPDPNVKTVCSIQIPTKEELWEKTINAPPNAWASAREFIPNLDEINSWELPDIDAATIWESTQSGTASAFGWLTEKTVDGSKATWNSATEFGADAFESVTDGFDGLKKSTTDLLFKD